MKFTSMFFTFATKTGEQIPTKFVIPYVPIKQNHMITFCAILLLNLNTFSTMDTTRCSNPAEYHMPTLPYQSYALAPIISAETIEYHFGKHLQAYVDNYNRLAKDSRFEGMTLSEVIANAPEGPLLNNAGQVLNHVLYFEQFTPYPTKNNTPTGNIADAIEFDFGSFDNLKKQMEEASLALFGSGWVWLAQEENGRLTIVSCKNGDTPARKGMTPLLGFDVWEYAYYLDYQNRRAEHIHNLWDIIDWNIVQSRMR